MKKKFNKIILLIIASCFLWLLLNSFRYPSNVYYVQNPFISLIVSVVILIAWYFMYMFLKRKIPEDLNRKYKIFLVFIYFILVTIIQVFVLNNFSVEPGWDFGVVFNNAYSFVLNGSRDGATYIEYFEYFPNNIMLFVLLVIFIKVGLAFSLSALQSAWIMNILFIDLALLLLFLVVNKRYGFKVSLFSLIITLFFLPIFLYTPIFYSDTLSMFAGIGFIYLYLCLIENQAYRKKYIVLLILFGLLAFFAKEIKVTSLIVLIAILFHFLLNSNLKKFVLSAFIICSSFALCSVTFKLLVINNSSFAFVQTGHGSYPYTHWLMMGVEDIDVDNSERNSVGGYSSSDYALTRSYKTGKDAIRFNLEEYANRIKKMGVIGYFNYLTKKGVNAWSDGLYFSDVKLSLNSRHTDSKLYQFFLVDQSTRYVLIYFSQGVQFAFLILLIGGSLIKKEEIDYVRLSLFGIMLFLLFWENRSRYLLNFIPLFILVIIEFYQNIVNLKYIRLVKNKC